MVCGVGLVRLRLRQSTLCLGKGVGLQDGGGSRTVVEQDRLAGVPDYVPGSRCVHHQLSELRFHRVQKLEACLSGDNNVAAVAGSVQPGELFGVEFLDHLQCFAVQDADASRVGDSNASVSLCGVRGGRAGRPGCTF
ncbi:hypothetical protein D3C73_1015000 [compost metagenome]